MNYQLDFTADTVGTGWMGDIEASPARIVEVFGAPGKGGDIYKISGEYVFVGDDGCVFVLHDWKATSVWDPEFPSPIEFWNSKDPEEFSISAVDDDIEDFKSWLESRLSNTSEMP